MNNPQSITSLPASPGEDRHRRMVNYSIAMGIRTVCVVIGIFMQGWWLLVFAIAAMVLPYFAVVLANNVAPRTAGRMERPGVMVPLAIERPLSTDHNQPYKAEQPFIRDQQ